MLLLPCPSISGELCMLIWPKKILIIFRPYCSGFEQIKTESNSLQTNFLYTLYSWAHVEILLTKSWAWGGEPQPVLAEWLSVLLMPISYQIIIPSPAECFRRLHNFHRLWSLLYKLVCIGGFVTGLCCCHQPHNRHAQILLQMP